MRTLAIQHVLTHPDAMRGGAIQALLLAREQVAMGHRVEVAYNASARRPPHATFRPWIEAGLVLRPYKMMDARGIWCSPLELLRFRRHLAETQADVIHAHRDSAVLFAFFASRGQSHAFVTQRGTTSRFNTATVAAVLRSPRVHRVIAVSGAVRDALAAQGVDDGRIEVVYGSFDATRFDPDRVDRVGTRERLGVAPAQKLVLMVGELNAKKSPETYIEACAGVLQSRPDAICMHAGAAKARVAARYAELARSRCGDRLRLLGWRNDVPDLLAAADVVVNSSSHGEGLTGALREALAMARPVVATAVDGNPEIVHHESTGLLVPRLDPPALAAAILRQLDDPDAARAMGVAGRELVLARMDPRKRAEHVERIYRGVLERPRRIRA